MAIKSRWFNGLTTTEQDILRKEIKQSVAVLERLSHILEDDLRRSVLRATEEMNFTSPSWPYQQAHKLGEQACLRKLLEFINIEE